MILTVVFTWRGESSFQRILYNVVKLYFELFRTDVLSFQTAGGKQSACYPLTHLAWVELNLKILLFPILFGKESKVCFKVATGETKRHVACPLSSACCIEGNRV